MITLFLIYREVAVAVQALVDHELRTVAWGIRDRTLDRVSRANGRIRTERSNIPDLVVVPRHAVGSRIAAISIPVLATAVAVVGVVRHIAAVVILAVDLAHTRDRGILAIDMCTGHTRAVRCHQGDDTLVIATILALPDA